MYKEKKKSLFDSKKKTLLVALVLLLCAVVCGTIMFLIDASDDVENVFKPTQVTSSVTEDISGNTKKDVMIQNTGNIDAYIRAAIVVTWQDEDGAIYPKKPVLGVDYYMELDLTKGWKLSKDGFYYYDEAVAPNDMTEILIKECYPFNDRTPEGYSLDVEILGSAIQSVPTNAVTSSWNSGVSSVDDDKLVIIQ